MKIFPSLISADILNLRDVIKNLDAHCDGYHIDIMDDHFVPNLTWGPGFTNAIRKETKLPLHVHLMVDNPELWPDRLELNSQDTFIFHYEVLTQTGARSAQAAHRVFEELVKELNLKNYKVGLAINPKTDVKNILGLLKDLDHILIMSVEPGFSGQKFMPEVLEKATVLINTRSEKKLSFTIGIDGGINFENIEKIKEKNIDTAGVASAIFYTDDYVASCKKLRA